MAEQKKLQVKVKLLAYATKNTTSYIERKDEAKLKQQRTLLETTLNDIEQLKYMMIEQSIAEEADEEQIDELTSGIERDTGPFGTILSDVEAALDEINQKKHATKQQYNVTSSTDRSPALATMAKLPKLRISNFDGTHVDWFRFWNQFEAEIDSSNISPVTKFSYLRESLPKQALCLVNGLPFTAEGYERSKNILRTKYGKTSEVVNAHIQHILNLTTINGTNTSRIHELFETLTNNVQALETLGRLKDIQGYVRMTLDKLPGIRSDLVRLDDDWQEWGFEQLIESLRKWTVRNPIESNNRRSNEHGKRNDNAYAARSNDYAARSNEHGKRRDNPYEARSDRKPQVCAFCDQEHKPTACTRVTDIKERRQILSTRRLCFNCTKNGHRASDCKSRSCFKCNGRHHTSICDKDKTQPMYTTINDTVIYPVVLVYVNGIKCRALLDSGAGGNYMSSSLAAKIKEPPKRREQRRIEMLMHKTSTNVKVFDIDVSSTHSEFKITVEAACTSNKEVLLHVPNPHYKRLQLSYEYLRNLKFYDHDSKEELPVHLILGVDAYCRLKERKEPKIGEPGQPIAELTKLGWVVMSPGIEVDTHMLLTQSSRDYDALCRLDVLGLEDSADGDQGVVYKEFKEQLQRDDEGWYETGLLWKPNVHELTNNKSSSLARLTNTLNKLNRNPETLQQYHQKIDDQLKKGIVEVAPNEVEGPEFYLPHKPVIRETAESTKLRIVYDASARTDTQSLSLNDCLETGPPLQNRLWNILARIRMQPIVLTADIKQAFHQIRIKREHRDALRFHWIDKATKDIITLRFTRAVFGLVQSPFLLNGTIEYHLEQWKDHPPEAVKKIKENIYVDDIIEGGDLIDEMRKLKEEIIIIFNSAKFELHKWHSNEPSLEVGEKDNNGEVKDKTASSTTAILGLKWDKREDNLKVTTPTLQTPETKRGVLKFLASIYDPLGFISPVTLVGKILYRDICDRKLGWDEPLPGDLINRWKRWQKSLPESFIVQRSIPLEQAKIERIDLHAFADASKNGTAASVYAVVFQKSRVSQGLLCSSSRLAKKSLSIPRLELVAAHMASNLLENVHQALTHFPVVNKVAWSDSTTALHWIKGDGTYKEFVRNRANKIRQRSEVTWRYINTSDNPIDIGSRGCHGNQLNESWNTGPVWMQHQKQWPVDITTQSNTNTEAESKQIKQVMATTKEEDSRVLPLLTKFSLWKVLRITAWIRRFIHNCLTSNKSEKMKGPLQTEEIESAKLRWIKQTQSNHENTDKFKEDKERLNLQKDHRDVYRCMGRIEGDYPIYLPSDDLFTQRMIEHSHKRTLHGGVGFTMADMRRRYWIPRLRQLIKSAIHRCHGCKRFHTIAFARPRPGNLPTDRTIGDRPFQVAGLDFAGPFTYLSKNKTERKCYILLYTCSLTRAVYLDVLKEQTLEAVISSLKAFVARRTRPSTMYSDNFSSFVAASKWIKLVTSQERLHDFLASQEMKWKFNLSRAPWWGGQFERLVGLMKQTLYKVLGKAKPRYEELQSLMLDVEVTMNNRPLGYVEDDVQSTILTPNLMMFDYPIEIPHLENIKEDLNVTVDLKKRYRYLKNARQRIWERWSNEYLKYLRERHNLTHREKGARPNEGDVVLIKGDERNRAKWKIGIVKNIMPGKDGKVRAVRLRAGQDFLERAPEHLFPLELSCDERNTTHKQNELNPKAREYLPRNTKAIARLKIADQVEDVNKVPEVE